MKNTGRLLKALNRMDELIEELGGTIEEREQQAKDYNLLFDAISGAKEKKCSHKNYTYGEAKICDKCHTILDFSEI